MTNSKRVLFFLLLVFNILQSSDAYAQVVGNPSGSLRREPSCNNGNPTIIVKNTPIYVSDPNSGPLYTLQSNTNGDYTINTGGPIPMFLTINPVRDSNHKNGVTVFDAALISGHVSGNQIFLDPFKRLAADVDNSGSVDAVDILKVQRLVTNITLRFPEVNSWRFVPQHFLNQPDFVTQFNAEPLAVDFQGFCYKDCGNSYMDKVTFDITLGDISAIGALDFRPFKMGDVNCSFNYNTMSAQMADGIANSDFNNADILSPIVANNRYAIQSVSNIPIGRGKEKTLVLKIRNTARVVALQLGLHYLPSKIAINNIQKGAFDGQNDVFDFNKEDNGEVRALWYNKRLEEKTIVGGTVLLKAKVKAHTNINDVLEVLNLDDRILQNEFYDRYGNLVPVEMYWEVESNTSPSMTEKSLMVNAFPNPFDNQLSFDIHSPVSEKAKIRISSLITGQNIEIQRELTQGLNTITIDNVSSLPAGILTYTIRYAENEVVTGRITKLK